jgi:hypothetical protein
LRADRRRQKAGEAGKVWREGWTIFALFVAAIASAAAVFVSIRVGDDQHKDAVSALQAPEAGWLIVVPEDVAFDGPNFGDNLTAHSNLWIRNRGHTPVTDVFTEAIMRTFLVEQLPAFTYAKGGHRNCQEVGVINPDISRSDDPVLAGINNPSYPVYLGDDTEWPGSDAPLKPISRSEFQQLLEGHEVILLYGRTSYVDVFKQRHWIHFCRTLPPSTELAPNIKDKLSAAPARKIQRACLSYNAVEPRDENYDGPPESICKKK